MITRLYTIEEIAEAASVSTKTVERLIGAGELRARNIASGTKGGKRWRVSEEDFRSWFESRPLNEGAA